MPFILEVPEGAEFGWSKRMRRGRLFVSRNYRDTSPGYLFWTDRLDQARLWRTQRGVEKFQEARRLSECLIVEVAMPDRGAE